MCMCVCIETVVYRVYVYKRYCCVFFFHSHAHEHQPSAFVPHCLTLIFFSPFSFFIFFFFRLFLHEIILLLSLLHAGVQTVSGPSNLTDF